LKKHAARIGLLGMACVLAVASAAWGQAKPLNFDVREFGAKGDGKTLDTEAVNKAIEAASKNGGGTVFFRAGTYPTFSIHLMSNVTLYLDQGARILAAGPSQGGLPGPGARRNRGGNAATNRAENGGVGVNTGTGATGDPPPPPTEGAQTPVDGTGPMGTAVSAEVLSMAPAYDAAEPNKWGDLQYQDFGHSHWHNSLMWGENLVNVAIVGPGMIDGNGLAYNPPGAAEGIGNKAFALKNCRNVILRDVTFYRSGHFSILATAVDNFTIDNVKFDTNRDAIDVVSCKNVRISNCYVNSPYDDGICLKADYSLGAVRDTENVTITNCQVSGYWCGTLLDGTYVTDREPAKTAATGRIKFGTESNGGFKNITISNVVFDHCRGLAIESVDGGVIEDVTITNLTMRDITNSPIFIRLGDRRRGPEGTPVAQIRRVEISNISATANNPALPVLISGIPGHSIEDLRISNVRIVYPGGGTREQAERTVPENEKSYPEPNMFGGLSASGFFIRHVVGLQMHHIDVSFRAEDARPIFVMEDVQGADFQHMKIQRFPGVPYFSLKNVSDLSTQFVRGLKDGRVDRAESQVISE
jgi:polygalacturonase